MANIEKPLKTTVFTRVFEGTVLKKTLENQHFQSKHRLRNHSKFLYRFLLDLGQFGTPFGTILGSLLNTFGVLRCLGLGFGRLWAPFVVNLGILGATWSSWGHIFMIWVSF